MNPLSRRTLAEELGGRGAIISAGADERINGEAWKGRC